MSGGILPEAWELSTEWDEEYLKEDKCMVNILVCVKQVPDEMEVPLDQQTHNMAREGRPGVINPFDSYALEMAVRLKEQHGGKVVLLSMGPQQAISTLRHGLSVGGDSAWLVCDPKLRGADALATSTALVAAVRHIEKKEGTFDMLFCGKQSTDGNTSQVAPQIAEFLGIPQAACVEEVECDQTSCRALCETSEGYERIQVLFPCLISVSIPKYEPRLPSIKGKITAKKAAIPVLRAEEIGLEPKHCGMDASGTWVEAVEPYMQSRTCHMLSEPSEEKAGHHLALLLQEKNLLKS